ncbi:MAG: hypothetical protein WDZ51_07900 [Pirellulaceae bacterium]
MLRRLIAHRLARPAMTTGGVAAMWLAASSVALACPTCKEGLGGNFVQAYGFSIIFMMSMPFAILAAFVFYFLTVGRRTKPDPRDDLSDPIGLASYAQRKAAEGVRTQPPPDLLT